MSLNPAAAFCTDEAIAAEASADFVLLCNRRSLGTGADGSFAAGSPWQLSSGTVAMQSQGIAEGSVAWLRTPASQFGQAGELYGVDSVSGSTANLRMVNQKAGIGNPPAPSSGLSGVSFSFPTLAAQIEIASYDLNMRFQVNDIIAGRMHVNLWDPRELERVCVLTVLYKRYMELARMSEQGQDLYYAKSRTYKQELDDQLARVTIHWKGVPETMAQSNPVMRLVR